MRERVRKRKGGRGRGGVERERQREEEKRDGKRGKLFKDRNVFNIRKGNKEEMGGKE